MAVGNAVLDLLQTDGLFGHVNEMGRLLMKASRNCKRRIRIK